MPSNYPDGVTESMIPGNTEADAIYIRVAENVNSVEMCDQFYKKCDFATLNDNGEQLNCTKHVVRCKLPTPDNMVPVTGADPADCPYFEQYVEGRVEAIQASERMLYRTSPYFIPTVTGVGVITND